MRGNPDQSITNVLPLKDLESRVRPELTRWVAVATTSLSLSVTLFSDLISSRSDVLIRGRCRVVVLLLAFNLLAINLPVWKKIPRLLWQEIKSLVVIKRAGEAKQALLLPGEEYFLSQNLRLELESARLSVLRADSGNLRASIVLIQSWLRQYFDTNDSAVINVMETLDQMQAIELQPALPDISSSVESLRAYLRGAASEAVSAEEIPE